MCSRVGKQRKKKRVGKRTRKMTANILVKAIIFIRIYLDWLIDYLFSFYYEFNREILPAANNPLVLESATSLARKIRERSVTSEEVVQAFINRINEVNGIINAVVDSRFDDAIAEARQIDQDIKDGKITEEDFQTKPFLGVPYTTKESTLCEGMKSTFGILCRKDKIAKENAEVILSMKRAGGILLSITNIPQVNMAQETSNPVYGVTNNPYNTTRNVGGSSGGEAAIISACGSPFGIGTDIGGSIRIPAFMCGLFGHKPTTGLITTKGLTFRTGKEGPTMVTAGTITKYSEDIIPFLKVLIGDEVNKLKLDEKVDVKKLQIYYVPEVEDLKMSAIGEEMQEVIQNAVNHFAEISASTPQKLELPNLTYGGKLWRYWLSQEKTNFRSDLMDRQDEANPLKELLNFILRRSDYTIATICMLINSILPQENEKWAQETTKQLIEELTEKLGTNSVLLYPSAPWSARYHYTSTLRPWNFYYFAIWNALKLPVTQVPLGLDKEGLPVGIQVVAGPHQDHLCIAVAKELEKAFGGYVPPFTLVKE